MGPASKTAGSWFNLHAALTCGFLVWGAVVLGGPCLAAKNPAATKGLPDHLRPDKVETIVATLDAAQSEALNDKNSKVDDFRNDLATDNADKRRVAILRLDRAVIAFARAEHGAISHGCVRLEKPLDLATSLLDGTMDRAAIDKILKDTDTKAVKLSTTIAVMLLYGTCFCAGRRPAFRDDVYGWDAKLGQLLREHEENS